MRPSPLLQRLVDRVRLPVITRSTLERAFDAATLDRWFETVAQQQCTRKLLFPILSELMVPRQSRLMRAAWLAAEGEGDVSLMAVCAKRTALEVSTSAAPVSLAGERPREVMAQWRGAALKLLPGQQLHVLDGNGLHARQHRLVPTRCSTAALLPGKTLVVFDPQVQTIEAMMPYRNGFAQEHSLLGRVASLVGVDQVWLAARDICAEAFLGEVAKRGAYSLIREHGLLRFTRLKAMRVAKPAAPAAVRVQRAAGADRGARRQAPVPRTVTHRGQSRRAHAPWRGRALPARQRARDAGLCGCAGAAVPPALNHRVSFPAANIAVALRGRDAEPPVGRPIRTGLCDGGIQHTGAAQGAAGRGARRRRDAAVEPCRGQPHVPHGRELGDDRRAREWHIFARATPPTLAPWLLDRARLVPLARHAKVPTPKSPVKPAVRRQRARRQPHVSIDRLGVAERAKARWNHSCPVGI